MSSGGGGGAGPGGDYDETFEGEGYDVDQSFGNLDALLGELGQDIQKQDTLTFDTVPPFDPPKSDSLLDLGLGNVLVNATPDLPIGTSHPHGDHGGGSRGRADGVGNLTDADTMGGRTQGETTQWSDDDAYSWARQQQQLSQETASWHQRTIDRLQQANVVVRHAAKTIVEDDVLHNARRTAEIETSVRNVHRVLKKKMGGTEDLVKALEDRLESMEDTLRQSGECLFTLQRAMRSKWAPLNVCERRLELRNNRPPQELVRDRCQEAMEYERKVLIESRLELVARIEDMKEALVNLDASKNSITEDLQHKRHALRIDRYCLASPRRPGATAVRGIGGGSVHGTASPTSLGSSIRSRNSEFGGTSRGPGDPGSPAFGGSQRLVLPSLQDLEHYGAPPSPNPQHEKGSGRINEKDHQARTKDLINAAIRLEEDSVRLMNDSDVSMLHTQRECKRATGAAQDELIKKVQEMSSLRQQLATQLLETEATINQTESSLANTKRRLMLHDKPLRALDKQFAARGRRTAREHIRDPVHDEMECHLDNLKQSVQSTQSKFQATQDVLDQLKMYKQQLLEDHRTKQAAQKIDDACLRVTPRKAIELDRLDPRGGRCHEPASRRGASTDLNKSLYGGASTRTMTS